MSLKQVCATAMHRVPRWMGEWATRAPGYLVAVVSVSLASLLALALEPWVTNHALVLLYVLAVVLVGLGWGARPAILASLLVFLGFNFFLTEPRLTLRVARRDELATLLILFLIALLCGQAASRLRRQFMQLVAANRSSRSVAELGRRLALASDPNEVWQALADGLAEALGVACRVVGEEQQGERLLLASGGEDRADGVWTVLPVAPDTGIRVEVRLALQGSGDAASPGGLPAMDELPAVLIRHAADTWRRIAMARELEAERLRSDMERLRSALLASVSHDLKSPLAAMMGCAESLELLDGQLSPEDRRALLDTILRESRRLESYIQNLLDMTRLGHGELRIERDWVPLEEIIGSAVKRLKRYLPETRVDYHSACPGQLLWVHGALVEQAIFNILENAARFSPVGESVRIETEVVDGDCVIAVEDRGPGIPAPLREQVFDMFYVVNEGDRRQAGTGMGLAICRGMIGAHGGTVHIEDGRAGGARLVVRLPLPDVDPAVLEQVP